MKNIKHMKHTHTHPAPSQQSVRQLVSWPARWSQSRRQLAVHGRVVEQQIRDCSHMTYCLESPAQSFESGVSTLESIVWTLEPAASESIVYGLESQV